MPTKNAALLALVARLSHFILIALARKGAMKFCLAFAPFVPMVTCLVLPDLVQDVSNVVKVEAPVAGAFGTLRNKTMTVNYTLQGGLELRAKAPTAMVENPRWFPTAEDLIRLSPEQKAERVSFFVSAHIVAWLTISFIGTLIMTRCWNCWPLASPYVTLEVAERTGVHTLLAPAYVLATLAVSTCAVGVSMTSGRLSTGCGLDFEVYFILFVLQGLNLLLQAAAAMAKLPATEHFETSTFMLGTIAAMMPFLADSFDMLKDVVFAGLCLMSGHWEVKVMGILSWAWLVFVYYNFLDDTKARAELSLMYKPFSAAVPQSAQPKEDPKDCMQSVWAKLEKALYELYKQTTSAKRKLILWESGPQGLAAVVYLWREGGSPFVGALQLALPAAQLLFAHVCHRPLAQWTIASTRRRLEAAHATDNTDLQRALLLSILDLEDPALSVAVFGKLSASVQVIYLSEYSIGDTGATTLAEALKVNSSVQVIYLDENSIGDTGATALAEALKVNASVKRIELRNNSIGEVGATALAEALKVNASVQLIGLTCNSIGEVGATALAEALKVNASVHAIYLSRNSIGEAGRAALAEAEKAKRVAFLM